jgi:hypothetical protein
MMQYEIKVPITSKCSRSKNRNSPLGVNIKFMSFKIKGLLLKKEQHCNSLDDKVQKEASCDDNGRTSLSYSLLTKGMKDIMPIDKTDDTLECLNTKCSPQGCD